MENQTVKLRN